VIYSNWFTIANWADSSFFLLGNAFRGIQNVTSLTQPIIDNGVILTYLRQTSINSTGPVLLPFTCFGCGAPGNPLIIGSMAQPGKIIFYNKFFDGTTGFAIAADLRYILVPGGVLGGRMANGSGPGYTANQLKAMSYHDVCKLLSISE
jgi:hypothetical protein